MIEMLGVMKFQLLSVQMSNKAKAFFSQELLDLRLCLIQNISISHNFL